MPVSVDPKTLELWRTVPYLAHLPQVVVQELANVATRHSYRANEMLFGEGEPVAGLFLVESGTVKVCRFSKEGREQILHLFHHGDTFNDVPALDGGPNAATAIAFTDATLWRIARTDLQHIAQRHPALAWALIESIARRTRHLVGLVHDLSMRNVKGRLARLLLEQTQPLSTGEMPRALTQEEMASRLGTVREVVGRALRNLTSNGIIEFDRHRIVILDQARLSEEAEM